MTRTIYAELMPGQFPSNCLHQKLLMHCPSGRYELIWGEAPHRASSLRDMGGYLFCAMIVLMIFGFMCMLVGGPFMCYLLPFRMIIQLPRG